MRILPLPAAVALLALTAACSSPFKRIYPGMTEAQVSAVMEQAPSRTDLFEEDYAAWYYGEDHCLLLHEGVVVAKQQTEETAAVSTPVGTPISQLWPGLPAELRTGLDAILPGAKPFEVVQREKALPYAVRAVRVHAQGESSMKMIVSRMMLVAVLFTGTASFALDGSSKDAAYLDGSSKDAAYLDGSSKDAAYFMSWLWDQFLSLAGARS